MVADSLSKRSLGTELGVKFYEQPPSQVSRVLNDLCAVPKSRNIEIASLALSCCCVLGLLGPPSSQKKKSFPSTFRDAETLLFFC